MFQEQVKTKCEMLQYSFQYRLHRFIIDFVYVNADLHLLLLGKFHIDYIN